jgi:DNA-binding beta-propeller fold protein YncE
MKKFIYYILTIVLITGACTKLDNDTPDPLPPGQLGNGFYVLNQGNFTSGNASLSFFSEDSAKMINNIFFKLNNAPLGDVAQSITLWRDEAYIVVNNSAYIYVIDSKTGLFKRKLAELQSPRFIQIIDADKAYISDFQLKGLMVFNPMNMQPLGVIETGKTTEAMAMVDYEVFATNWSSYNQTSTNNTVQVIDAIHDKLVDSIVVAKEPNSLVVDKHKKLWVLCSGGFMNEEIPALIRIDPASRTIEKRFNFPVLQSSPEQLRINKSGDQLYFLNGDVYAMHIDEEQLPSDPKINASGRNFFTLAVHPEDQTIIVTDAGNYVQNGWVFRFASDGMLIDSAQAGIIPGFIGFIN